MNEENKHERSHSSSFDEHERFCDRLSLVIGDESIRSFALRANLSPPVIKKYVENDSTPNVERLVAIAEAAGVTVEWLATGKGPKYPNGIIESGHQQIMEGRCGAYKANNDFLSEFALIPGYNVQVSAGWGCEGSDELEPTRYLAFRRRWLKWRGFSENDLTLVWAKGDSMDTTISDNDTLLVHMKRNQPTDGNIFVIRNHNQLWVKRVQVMPNSWLLLSDNKVYQSIEVPMDEQHNFQVIGQVVHIAKDIGN